MQNNPLVSILVPIYNVEEYLGPCLDSLFSQTYNNLEYVFVNDCTHDNSIAVLNSKIEQYGVHSKIVLINNDKNVGLAGTRIEAVKAAKGDYFFIVDSDDYIATDAIELLLSCAIKNKADIVESNFYFYSDSDIKEYRRVKSDSITQSICLQLSLSTPVALWSKLYRRELFDDVDSLFIVGSRNIEDYHATPLLYNRARKVCQIEDFLYYYRVDNISSGSRNRAWSKIENLQLAIKKHEDFFAKDGNQAFTDAIFDAKYYVIVSNFLSINDNDRKRLSLLYPELDAHVRVKPFKERCLFYIIRHNNVFYYRLFRKIFTFFGL